MANILVPSLAVTSVLDQIQKKRERLRALRLSNQSVSSHIETVDSQILDAKAKYADEVQRLRQDLSCAKASLVYTREKLERKQDESGALNRFLQKHGLSIGYGEEAPGRMLKSIHFSGLWKHEEDCIIYFSEMKLPSFKVTSSDPRVRKFDELAAEVNETKNFIYLLVKAREYFLQYVEKYSSDSMTFSIIPNT